jgi:hypothetical protein
MRGGDRREGVRHPNSGLKPVSTRACS